MLIEKLKIDRIQAMKDKNDLSKNLLSTLIGEASRDEKIPSDDKVIATIRKFIKGCQEMQVNVANAQGNQSYINKAQLEIYILESYLPKQLFANDIEDIIKNQNELMKESVGENVSISFIMKYFKENYAGRYDGKYVATIFKELI